ncbi:MAG TPA: substrate-binding domain-containing protein [Burkholderiales bacterium]|nr:substrate-binding domain-containing protein [Burkholderiales bacterium]
MATLRILSAGAAQAVTERIIEAFKRDTGSDVVADFGAVGAMKAKVIAGEAVDVIILTQPMIDELIAAGLVQPGSRIDLGKVGTGVAVRAGIAVPDVSSADLLRARILSASKIAFPDPAVATAGKIVMSLLEKLGALEEVRARLQLFPNGYAAMKWLATTEGTGELGITQVTEILPNKGVTYAGPLPEEFQMKAVYSIGLAARAPEPELAKDFVARFNAASARPLLAEAGYEFDRH